MMKESTAAVELDSIMGVRTLPERGRKITGGSWTASGEDGLRAVRMPEQRGPRSVQPSCRIRIASMVVFP